MNISTLPTFINNIPLISGDFSNSKNIYIEEFLTFKNNWIVIKSYSNTMSFEYDIH